MIRYCYLSLLVIIAERLYIYSGDGYRVDLSELLIIEPIWVNIGNAELVGPMLSLLNG